MSGKKKKEKKNKFQGLIIDEKIRKENKEIHSGLEGELDDNEIENTLQKGFDHSGK